MGSGMEDQTHSEAMIYHVVDRLRDDLRREIDQRLRSEADARQATLTALERRSFSLPQATSIFLSVLALALSMYALFARIK